VTLFDAGTVGRVRHTDPDTSVDAARTVDAGAIEAAVLAEFARFGWLTDDELVEALPLLHGPSVKSARSRLSTGKGRPILLVATGTKRPSNTGHPMNVWKLAPPESRA